MIRTTTAALLGLWLGGVLMAGNYTAWAATLLALVILWGVAVCRWVWVKGGERP